MKKHDSVFLPVCVRYVHELCECVEAWGGCQCLSVILTFWDKVCHESGASGATVLAVQAPPSSCVCLTTLSSQPSAGPRLLFLNGYFLFIDWAISLVFWSNRAKPERLIDKDQNYDRRQNLKDLYLPEVGVRDEDVEHRVWEAGLLPSMLF